PVRRARLLLLRLRALPSAVRARAGQARAEGVVDVSRARALEDRRRPAGQVARLPSLRGRLPHERAAPRGAAPVFARGARERAGRGREQPLRPAGARACATVAVGGARNASPQRVALVALARREEPPAEAARQPPPREPCRASGLTRPRSRSR